MRKSSRIALLFFLFAGRHFAADSISKGFSFADITAGQKVTVPGTFSKGAWRVKLTDLSKDTTALEKDATAADTSLSFDLPNDFDGRYRVTFQLGTATPLDAPGELRVLKPSELPVTLDALRVPVPYRNPDHGNKYDFEIAGTNFSPFLDNNIVEINKVPIDVERGAACSGGFEKACLTTEAGNNTRKLILSGFDADAYPRPMLVRVRVGNGKNVSAQLPLTLARISERGVKLLSFAVFGLVVLAVYQLVRKGIRSDVIEGQTYGPLYAFLMDRETNSYSLSKFQLLLFTLVAIFGYIYVLLCRMFVQWNFVLPPVPDDFPAMLAVSAGTTITAAGITVTRGNHGAGAMTPSPADFVSAGGLVLPERFQFFVWTLVSSFGLLAVLLASDPATLTTLPDLPQGMLYLMGLSSAGYLGGKLVRGPGPRITSIDAAKVDLEPKDPNNPEAKALKVTLTGESLSNKATFQLDGKSIPADQTKLESLTPPGEEAHLCTAVTFRLDKVAEIYFGGPHTLRIVNPDTQAADASYGAVIESVKDVQHGDTDTDVTVIGRNFKDPSSAKWRDATIETTNVTKKSEAELTVKLKPGPAGAAKLTIVSPGDLETSADVKVL